MRRGFVFLLAGLLTAAWGTSIVRAVRVAGSGTSLGIQARTETLSTDGCRALHRSRLDYQWPVKPFAAQHPIRGNFGDPRTISRKTFGVTGPGVPGQYSFHNGVDIAAAPGTPVYAVVSGTAYWRDGDAVFVRSGDRYFQYRHITPTVQPGERVEAGVTVLGRVRFPANHVHLTEIDGADEILLEREEGDA